MSVNARARRRTWQLVDSLRFRPSIEPIDRALEVEDYDFFLPDAARVAYRTAQNHRSQC